MTKGKTIKEIFKTIEDYNTLKELEIGSEERWLIVYVDDNRVYNGKSWKEFKKHMTDEYIQEWWNEFEKQLFNGNTTRFTVNGYESVVDVFIDKM